MQRRFSTILILSLLLVAFGAMTAFSAKAPIDEQQVKSLKVDKSVYYSYPNEDNFEFGELGNRPLRNATRVSSYASPGIPVGDTWYDYQHNGTIGRMIGWGPFTTDGSGNIVHDAGAAVAPGVHFAWMNLPGPVLTARAYNANHWNATSGTFAPGSPVIIQASDEYAGYVCLDVAAENRAIVGGHNNPGTGYAPHFYWDFLPMFAFWSLSSRVPDATMHFGQTFSPPVYTIWPKMAYQEGTQTVTHVIAQESHAAAADPQAIYYFRKVGANETGTWDASPYIVDTIFDLSHDVAAEMFGDKVALVWTANLPNAEDVGICDTCSGESEIHVQWDNDIYYQISNDQGVTWQPRVNVTQNVNGEAGFRPYTDLTSLMDHLGNLHIVYSAVVWPENPAADGWGYNCRLFHWSEDNPYIRTVHNADFDQLQCQPGVWNVNASKMQVSECDGKLYVMWVQFGNPETHPALDDCAARAAGGTGSIAGAHNADLYIAVSSDNGLTWDKARNLTNSYTPNCDPANGGIDCANDNWPSMTKYGRQNQAGDNFSGVPIVDPSGSYAGDMYLDIQYVADKDAGGAITPEGTWTLGAINWFRVPCVEPVPNPLPIYTPARVGLPTWVKPNFSETIDLTIENAGNVALTYTPSTFEDNGAAGWLNFSGLGGSVPSGLGNTETGSIILNQGGVQTTEALLIGGIIIDHNGATDVDTVHVRLLVADTLVATEFDTIIGGCLALGVATQGETGQQGTGNVNMDWDYSGSDCDTNADVYLYSGGPVMLTEDGTDTLMYTSAFGTTYLDSTGFRPLGGHCADENADYARYVTDTFVDLDSTVAMQRVFFAPKSGTDCDYVVQYLKVWSFDGAAHNGLRLGEIIDWDIPSDTGSDNTSGFDFGRNLIYQQGVEYAEDCDSNAATPDENCSDCPSGTAFNNERFGGLAFVESFINGSSHQTTMYSAYTAENDTFVYPNGTFVPYELWVNMEDPGFSTSDSTEDLHMVMTYEPGLNLGATDVYEVYTVIATVQEGTAADLGTAIDDAKAWMTSAGVYADSKQCVFGCCLGNTGNVDNDPSVNDILDISDLLYLVDFFFLPGSPGPVCAEEADVNGSTLLDISDLLYLVDFFFLPGSPAPVPCL